MTQIAIEATRVNNLIIIVDGLQFSKISRLCHMDYSSKKALSRALFIDKNEKFLTSNWNETSQIVYMYGPIVIMYQQYHDIFNMHICLLLSDFEIKAMNQQRINSKEWLNFKYYLLSSAILKLGDALELVLLGLMLTLISTVESKQQVI